MGLYVNQLTNVLSFQGRYEYKRLKNKFVPDNGDIDYPNDKFLNIESKVYAMGYLTFNSDRCKWILLHREVLLISMDKFTYWTRLFPEEIKLVKNLDELPHTWYKKHFFKGM